jgi:hypothetical protein
MSSWFRLPALVAGILVVTIAAAAVGSGFELLSKREYQSELDKRATAPQAPLILKGADFNAPVITVVSPDHSGPIKPPVDIDLEFKAVQGANVDIGTLKIFYGFLHLDITQRILQAPGVQISPAGLKASGAQLPSGSHKLLIQVADNLGRTARQPVEFVVQ